MVNLGSFSAGQPDVQNALQQAIAARQSGGQPVAQAAQTGQGEPSAPPQEPGVQAVPQGMAQGQGQMSAPPSEAEMIIKALQQRLSSISTVEKAQNMSMPSMPSGSTTSAPVGGGGCGSRRY